ncbi:hypothetical protein [Peribacillus kribbensis]|uniref:hypothetical protein n=1 Tax=Peribacillus kribbensis TaxID=356658 RepID=UPI0004257537|nr:hypothetical protein [Peribacillus kribbensis]
MGMFEYPAAVLNIEEVMLEFKKNMIYNPKFVCETVIKPCQESYGMSFNFLQPCRSRKNISEKPGPILSA